MTKSESKNVPAGQDATQVPSKLKNVLIVLQAFVHVAVTWEYTYPWRQLEQFVLKQYKHPVGQERHELVTGSL